MAKEVGQWYFHDFGIIGLHGALSAASVFGGYGGGEGISPEGNIMGRPSSVQKEKETVSQTHSMADKATLGVFVRLEFI